jgi:hypothetical protein
VLLHPPHLPELVLYDCYIPESNKSHFKSLVRENYDSSTENFQKIISYSVSWHGKDICVLSKVI